MRYRFVFSQSVGGRMEAWMDGRKVVDESGPNVYANELPLTSFKFGPYREAHSEELTLFFDDYSRGPAPD
jgi:hypothetical protein